MDPWWIRMPERLESELEALMVSGYTVTRDPEAEGRGVMVLGVSRDFDGTIYRFRVVFPDLYPYFRPQIYGEDFELRRHQNLFENSMCLLPARTHYWRTAGYNVAKLLDEQFPKVLKANNAKTIKEAKKSGEERNADPISRHFHSLANLGSFILIDSDWNLPQDITSGELTIRFSIAYGIGLIVDASTLKGIVSEIRADDGKIIESWHGSIPTSFNNEITVRWARTTNIPKQPNPSLFRSQLKGYGQISDSPELTEIDDQHQAEIAGLVFPEELQWRQDGDGWVFVLSLKAGTGPTKCSFVKVYRGGAGDLGARVPARKSFHGKKIAVFGVGAIGAPVAIELARNGSEKVHIIDDDTVEPGPTIRWPFGVSAYGKFKTQEIKSFISANYPDTAVQTHEMQVGRVRHKTQNGDHYQTVSQAEVLDGILDDVDLVIDTTAEVGVSHLLSDLAKAKGVPLVCAYATPGAWGGLVSRFGTSAEDPCFICLRYALYGDKSIPEPPADLDTGETQPPGCSDPTFLGASFDLMEVSLETMRVVAGTLSTPKSDGYPDIEEDVSILSLRAKNGVRISPRWRRHILERHTKCQQCNPKK